jgi:hypothetical protein
LSHHPSLSEALKSECDVEWLELNLESLTIKDWANSRSEIGNICEMAFIIVGQHCSSEYGTHNFKKTVLNVFVVEEELIQNLKGDYPLGSIQYYEEDCVSLNINITEKLLSHLLPFIANDLSGLKVRVSIPDLNFINCLPLMDYQVFYESRTKI